VAEIGEPSAQSLRSQTLKEIKMKKYECWVVLDDSGHLFGHFDYTNGGFKEACNHCAYLNHKYPEFYSMVLISG